MLKALTLASALALAGTTFAHAGSPGADWMSKVDLKTKMPSEGYSAIVAGADDGHWEGEAVKDGRIVEFHADAHTGKITKSEPKRED